MGATGNHLSLAAAMTMLLLIVEMALAGPRGPTGVHRPGTETISEAGAALFSDPLWAVAGRRRIYPEEVVLL